jgi:hypothetical protein
MSATTGEETGLEEFISRIGPVVELKSWTQERTGSSCRVLRSASLGLDVFVKQVPERIGDAVERDYGSLLALHRGAPGTVPEPLAWGLDPPYMAYVWVPGPELSDVLAGTATVEGRNARLITSSGRALARIHAVDSAALPGGARRTLDGRPATAGLVPSIVDLGPWNCIVQDDSVVFIDTQLRLARPEFDVGRLSVSVARKVVGPAGGPLTATRCGWRVSRLMRQAYEEERTTVGGPHLSSRSLFSVVVRTTLVLGWRDVRGRRRGRAIGLTVGLLLAEVIGLVSEPVRRLSRTTTTPLP